MCVCVCVCLFGSGEVVVEVTAVDFGYWLVDRGFTIVGLQIGCFGLAVYMGV